MLDLLFRILQDGKQLQTTVQYEDLQNYLSRMKSHQSAFCMKSRGWTKEHWTTAWRLTEILAQTVTMTDYWWLDYNDSKCNEISDDLKCGFNVLIYFILLAFTWVLLILFCDCKASVVLFSHELFLYNEPFCLMEFQTKSSSDCCVSFKLSMHLVFVHNKMWKYKTSLTLKMLMLRSSLHFLHVWSMTWRYSCYLILIIRLSRPYPGLTHFEQKTLVLVMFTNQDSLCSGTDWITALHNFVNKPVFAPI